MRLQEQEPHSARNSSPESRLVPYLQPLYSVGEKRVRGAEVLVRRRDPDGTIQLPETFLPALEAAGDIGAVDLWMLRQTCGLLAEWRTRWPELRLNCNVSRLTLLEEDFVDRVDAILRDTGAEPERLTLEITETSHGVLSDKLEPPLDALRTRGISVAIDDFGAEASSLGMLYLPQPSMVKLDRELVAGAETRDRAKTVLSGVAVLCHRLGMVCVAEGVETKAQMEWLEAIGCDWLQGYCIGRPMPADEFFARFAPHMEGTP